MCTRALVQWPWCQAHAADEAQAQVYCPRTDGWKCALPATNDACACAAWVSCARRARRNSRRDPWDTPMPLHTHTAFAALAKKWQHGCRRVALQATQPHVQGAHVHAWRPLHGLSLPYRWWSACFVQSMLAPVLKLLCRLLHPHTTRHLNTELLQQWIYIALRTLKVQGLLGRAKSSMRNSLLLLAEAVKAASAAGRSPRIKKAAIDITDTAAERARELLLKRNKVRASWSRKVSCGLCAQRD